MCVGWGVARGGVAGGSVCVGWGVAGGSVCVGWGVARGGVAGGSVCVGWGVAITLLCAALNWPHPFLSLRTSRLFIVGRVIRVFFWVTIFYEQKSITHYIRNKVHVGGAWGWF